jgi:hypothetical protein
MYRLRNTGNLLGEDLPEMWMSRSNRDARTSSQTLVVRNLGFKWFAVAHGVEILSVTACAPARLGEGQRGLVQKCTARSLHLAPRIAWRSRSLSWEGDGGANLQRGGEAIPEMLRSRHARQGKGNSSVAAPLMQRPTGLTELSEANKACFGWRASTNDQWADGRFNVMVGAAGGRRFG